MTSAQLKIALAQMTSVDRIDENLKSVVELYLKSVSQGAELIVFPENTIFFRIRSGAKLASPDWMGSEMSHLQSLVDQHGTALMLTTAMASVKGKFRNSTLLFERHHPPRVVYSKIHMFDVDVEGAPPVRESEHFERGEESVLLDFKGWKLGLSICYDLRFAELYLHYAQKADLILVPSAFLVPTGEAHWHTLLRARAIEAQAYVMAPAQSGEHKSSDQSRKTYGHSLGVDPWGRVLLDLKNEIGVQTVTLTRDIIDKVRKQIPMAAHRRLGRTSEP